jgi:signal transduction histidine kinase
MSRLFIRIYGAVVLALVLEVLGIGAFVWWTVLPDRNNSLADLLQPSLGAVAAQIDGGDDPKEVFARAEPWTGPTLALIADELLPLDALQLERLRSGDVVVTGTEFGRNAYAWVPSRGEAVELHLIGIETMATQWAALPLAHQVAGGAPSDRISGQPLPPGLGDLDRARLAWHPIVHNSQWFDRTSEVLMSASPGSARGALTVAGPREPELLRWFALVATFVLMAAAIAASLYPLELQLTALGDATNRLREGELGARVAYGGPGPVREVAEQFNRMADQVQQLVGTNEELLRSVSHELRTPVSRLFFSLDLLTGEEDPAARTELTANMHTTLLEVRDLTSELLTFTRLGDTAPQTQHEPVDLAEIATDVAAQWTRLPIDVEVTGPALVSGDARLLYRAIDNLVGNATRYGEHRIRVRVATEGTTAWVDVEDGGAGIPVEDRERVTRPFVRLESSRSRETGGAGLGLAIVQRVAERHQGTLSIDDSDLGGARFRLELPLLPADVG